MSASPQYQRQNRQSLGYLTPLIRVVFSIKQPYYIGHTGIYTLAIIGPLLSLRVHLRKVLYNVNHYPIYTHRIDQ